MGYLNVFMYKIMSFVHMDVLTFSNFDAFLSFFFLIALTDFSQCCKRSGCGHFCHIPDMSEKSFNFCLSSLMLSVDLSYIAFIILKHILLYLICWVYYFFYDEGMLNLIKAFSVSIEMVIWFLFFPLLMWFMKFIDLWILNPSCISGLNPTKLWCMIFLM